MCVFLWFSTTDDLRMPGVQIAHASAARRPEQRSKDGETDRMCISHIPTKE
jgi:hypothetical protein